MMLQKNNSLSNISKYRNELFGIAIVSIIIFHFFEEIGINNIETGLILSILINIYFFVIKQFGVDIFVFLSGMGLYYSMKKSESIKIFYKKRIERIIPVYVIWGGLYWIIKDIILLKLDLTTFILDFTTISFWIYGVKDIWYIPFILTAYICFPLVYKDLKSSKHSEFVTIAIIVPVVLLGIVSLKLFPEMYSKLEIAFWRIPVFVIGAFYGKRMSENDAVNMFDYALLFGVVCAKIAQLLFVRHPGTIQMILSLRVVNSIWSIGLIFIFVTLLSSINFEPFNIISRKCGSISLELYLTHVTLRELFNLVGFKAYEWYNYLLIILVSVIASICLHKVIDVMRSKYVYKLYCNSK